MRLIDADAFCAFLREVSTRQHYETLLTNKDKYPTVADVIEEVCCDLDGTGLNGFDNAPTVDTTCPHCDSGYAQGYSDGYLRGKEERPQGKWIYHKAVDYFLPCMECNNCHEEFLLNDLTPAYFKKVKHFCSNCGADMRKGSTE